MTLFRGLDFYFLRGSNERIAIGSPKNFGESLYIKPIARPFHARQLLDRNPRLYVLFVTSNIGRTKLDKSDSVPDAKCDNNPQLNRVEVNLVIDGGY